MIKSTIYNAHKQAFYVFLAIVATLGAGSGAFLSGATEARAEIKSTGWPDVAEKAVRSVVNISSTKTRVMSRGPGMDPFFRRFFGRGYRPPAHRATQHCTARAAD